MHGRLREAGASAVAYALIGVVVLAFVYCFTPVVVAGGSMLPALVPGDLVIVDRRTLPQRGDIALLRAGEGLVLHRVTGVGGDGAVTTRGDANPIGDLNPTPRTRVHGRVVRVVPVGKVVRRWRRVVPYGKLPAQTHSARQ